jgi:hypothetical protein
MRISPAYFATPGTWLAPEINRPCASVYSCKPKVYHFPANLCHKTVFPGKKLVVVPSENGWSRLGRISANTGKSADGEKVAPSMDSQTVIGSRPEVDEGSTLAGRRYQKAMSGAPGEALAIL